MKVDKHVNLVTLTVDLNSPKSVREAVSYITKSAANGSAGYMILTTKVRVIKMVRAFGEKVAESACVWGAGEVTHRTKGLKEAKSFVESGMDDLKIDSSL